MKLLSAKIYNFRRLEDVTIDLDGEDTVFVGPNNSGKTSATTAFRVFLGNRDFSIFDFTVSRIEEINRLAAADDPGACKLPSIGMDLSFSVDPKTEFGRVFSLLPTTNTTLTQVGIRQRLSCKSSKKLYDEYNSLYPLNGDGKRKRTVVHFLSSTEALRRHFEMEFFALDTATGTPMEIPLEPEEGRRLIRALLRVDFVDAQRNMNETEIGRSNRLSSAFADYYRKNLTQPSVNEAASIVIDDNNERLTKHYEEHFKGLMSVINTLGIPSVNDRKLRLVSTFDPAEALQGNTQLLYVDSDLEHELPEAYNGLGFKNVIYMAIQISHFHVQWMTTEVSRPLCQIIFIEEPEVHLHAQVQQTFINNIWRILRDASKAAGEPSMVPQLAITTHSTHILDTVDFKKVRYFRRCELLGKPVGPSKVLHASRVISLSDFRPTPAAGPAVTPDEKNTLEFLRRYLRLSHCDLFFADAAVLVEGSAEKLMMASMLERAAPLLRQRYITTLEVGGAYAGRLSTLLNFIGIPYVVISDIDSVDPSKHRSACRADLSGAITSNATLTSLLSKKVIADIVSITPAEQIVHNGTCYLAFQRPVTVSDGQVTLNLHGRTFEEAFVYENFKLFQDKILTIDVDFAHPRTLADFYEDVYQCVKSECFKKTQFALDISASAAPWTVPRYISDSFTWLMNRLSVN